MIRFKSQKRTFLVKGGGNRKVFSSPTGSDPDMAISEFESPKKSQQNSCEESSARKRPRERQTLVKQIKQTMAIHGSSAKSLSTYSCKNSITNDSSTLMRLIVLKYLYENVATWTLSLDVDSKQYKWVVFKPRKPNDIQPGACIKLFYPWQQIFIPSLNDDVIICTDFYNRCNPTDVGISENIVKEELSSTHHISKWKSFSAVPLTSEKLFSTMVPYAVINSKTISKQLSFHKSSVNLDVVICQIWKSPEAVFALVTDSDKFISAIEIDTENEDLCDIFSVGRFVSFSNLNVCEKVTTWSYMPLFSVISLYGSRQNFCYKLAVGPNTTWDVQILLHIPFRPKEPLKKTLIEVSMMEGEDFRFDIRAHIKYLNSNQLVIWDNSTNLKGKVEIIPAYKNQFLLPVDEVEPNYADLRYVRYFRGKLSMDRFSSIQFNNDSNDCPIEDSYSLSTYD